MEFYVEWLQILKFASKASAAKKKKNRTNYKIVKTGMRDFNTKNQTNC